MGRQLLVDRLHGDLDVVVVPEEDLWDDRDLVVGLLCRAKWDALYRVFPHFDPGASASPGPRRR